VALWFKSIGAESMFFWYVTAMCGIALIASSACGEEDGGKRPPR